MATMPCVGASLAVRPNGIMALTRGATSRSNAFAFQWKEASVGSALGAAFCAFQRLSGVRGRKAPSGARGAKRLAAATGRASRLIMGSNPQVAFVIGGPGSGKGTQCDLAAKELGFLHLSAGELLREERSRSGSPLAKEIEEAMTSAKPVPSEVIAKLLEQAMREAGAWKDGPAARFVVDGYPRSEEQLRGFQAELSSKVELLCCISLEVNRDEMRQRLLARAKSSGRVDDEEAVIEKRLNTFQADTDPLLEFFKAQCEFFVARGCNYKD
eukprot:symbB.v1.2.020315.t1/scaffold1702.1/size107242/6